MGVSGRGRQDLGTHTGSGPFLRASRLALLCGLQAVTYSLWLTGMAGCSSSRPGGSCVLEREPPTQAAVFLRHLGPACTDEEREAQAVAAEDVLSALAGGKAVDLAGVVINGDLLFDTLPQVPVGAVPNLPPTVREMFRTNQIRETRRLVGPLTIRKSLVRGLIGSRLREGYLIVEGPMILAGTTFERTADFSRTVFLGPVDGSDAVFQAPALFVQARFTQPVRFEQTVFGPHCRFHRSVFSEKASFLRARFNGLAEFLEVTFEKEVSFSRASFKMGTGFSGSRFGGVLDFSEATFEREAFFTFALFEQDAYFRRASFRGIADFSDAEFRGIDDFSKVLFEAQPNFSRVKASGSRRPPPGLQDPRILYAIAAILAVFTIIFWWVIKRS